MCPYGLKKKKHAEMCITKKKTFGRGNEAPGDDIELIERPGFEYWE